MLARTTITAAVAALALSACATHRINYTNPQAASGGAVTSHKQAFYLWGLVGGKQVDLAATCPVGVARITSVDSAGDSILTVITGGLYSPRSVEVQCAGGRAGASTDGGVDKLEAKRGGRP